MRGILGDLARGQQRAPAIGQPFEALAAWLGLAAVDRRDLHSRIQ
jgi:hypothetical protein